MPGASAVFEMLGGILPDCPMLRAGSRQIPARKKNRRFMLFCIFVRYSGFLSGQGKNKHEHLRPRPGKCKDLRNHTDKLFV